VQLTLRSSTWTVTGKSYLSSLNYDAASSLAAAPGRKLVKWDWNWGDGEIGNWRELRAEASRAHNNRTASYLVETPMLADYLEEALSEFGLSFEDFEEPL